jgi:hypothetical protein
VQRPLTSGPKGWRAGQTPWPVSPTLQPLVGWLCGDTLQEAVEGNSKLKVGGGRTPWATGHVARPVSHHLACKSVTPHWTPINTTLPVEINIPHSTCSSPLVKVPI